MLRCYLQTVIVYCLLQIKGERSIYSIFHIINGKKSSQSIQDAHLFQIAPFFQSYHFVNREVFDQNITQLLTNKWIRKTKEHHYLVTEIGKVTLEMQIIEKPFPVYLNGLTYQSMTETFWARLSLLVQVSSNLVHKQSQYIPIQRKDEIQLWLKNALLDLPTSRNELARQLFSELTTLFDQDHSLDPSPVIMRLTGYNHIGLTPQQAALSLGQEYTLYHLRFLNVIHFMIRIIEQDSKQYPILFSVIKDLQHPFYFTSSTMKTYELLRSGLTLNQIAQIRKLKQSTIEDHVVEITFNDKRFMIDPLLLLRSKL